MGFESTTITISARTKDGIEAEAREIARLFEAREVSGEFSGSDKLVAVKSLEKAYLSAMSKAAH